MNSNCVTTLSQLFHFRKMNFQADMRSFLPFPQDYQFNLNLSGAILLYVIFDQIAVCEYGCTRSFIHGMLMRDELLGRAFRYYFAFQISYPPSDVDRMRPFVRLALVPAATPSTPCFSVKPAFMCPRVSYECENACVRRNVFQMGCWGKCRGESREKKK